MSLEANQISDQLRIENSVVRIQQIDTLDGVLNMSLEANQISDRLRVEKSVVRIQQIEWLLQPLQLYHPESSPTMRDPNEDRVLRKIYPKI